MFIHFVLRLINFVLHLFYDLKHYKIRLILPVRLTLLTQASKNFLYKSKKFYAGTKKRCSTKLHLFAGSIK